MFCEETLFRIGGDELLMMCQCITEEDLTEKIELLQKKLKEKSVVLAIGMEYTPLLSDQSVEDLIKVAEKRMYENKSLYYKRNGLDRRVH